MKQDAKAELIGILRRFCSAFTDRDPDAVLRLCAPDTELVVVTSENAPLRGSHQLRSFLGRYVDGPVTYSWEWNRYDVSITGSCAWLLAEGQETAASGERLEVHPYRMTMVLTRSETGWLIRQVHGSSPQ